MKHYITLFIICLSYSVSAQVSVQFIPEINGRNVNSLFNCQLINAELPHQATLSISVNERNAGTICLIKTPQFTLPTGVITVPVNAARVASIQFSNSNSGRLTSLNNAFPAGDYEYCYTLNLIGADTDPAEQCFTYNLAPFAELNLIEPFDQEKITNKRPILTWQPLLPGVPGAYYQLVLTEIKNNQNATEALNYNLPIINQLNIVSPILPFPSIVRELEHNKKYAWQVTAYKNQTVLNRSEIWEFTVNSPMPAKKVVDDTGYRNIEDMLGGNYYIANGELRFAVINSYAAQKLQYQIQPLSHINAKIKRLPKLNLANGSNMIKIDLQATGSFIHGDSYILEVTLPNGSVKSLRFLYYDNQ